MVSAFQKLFIATGGNRIHENIVKHGSEELLVRVNNPEIIRDTTEV